MTRKKANVVVADRLHRPANPPRTQEEKIDLILVLSKSYPAMGSPNLSIHSVDLRATIEKQ